ncbi:MAG: hypothetical protein RLZZ127_1135 [Planctomycetota bacterium]|jgi:hypothetical protein
MMRLLLVAAALLVLGGCSDLETTYGARQGGSVNGIRVLDRLVADRAEQVRRSAGLGPHLDERADLLIHLAGDDRLPDDEAMDWLEQWLDESPRQAVIILRDGEVAAWLCRRWAAEARARGGASEAAKALAYDERARTEYEPPARSATSAWFDRRAGDGTRPRAIAGLGDPAVPEMMEGRGSLVSRHGDAIATLVMPDGSRRIWAMEIPHGSSRLVVVASAIPLLDGAMPDPAARRLATALVDDLIAWHATPPAVAWIRRLDLRDDDDGSANPMRMLFTQAPFAVVTWHLVGLALIALLAKAAHLGRRQAPRRERRAAFARHVEALARQLADGRHAAGAAGAIARARGLPPPPPLPDAAAARRWLAEAAERPVPSPESRP